jgi:hypothetical protein
VERGVGHALTLVANSPLWWWYCLASACNNAKLFELSFKKLNDLFYRFGIISVPFSNCLRSLVFFKNEVFFRVFLLLQALGIDFVSNFVVPFGHGPVAHLFQKYLLYRMVFVF